VSVRVQVADPGQAGRRAGAELAGWQGERLRHVYVDPAFLRQGIAGRLLRRVEGDYRERTGADEIRAGAALHAVPSHLAVGYTLAGYARAWDGSSYAEMVKPLVAVRPPGSSESG
jgi:GNAT superfamily N-acetyltransferase